MKKIVLFLLVLSFSINNYSQATTAKNSIVIEYDEVIGCIDIIHGKINITTAPNKFIITHTTYSTTYSNNQNKNFFNVYRGDKPKLIYDLLKKLKTNSKLHTYELEKTNHYVIFTVKTGTTKEKYKYQVAKWNGLEIFFKKLEKYKHGLNFHHKKIIPFRLP